MSIKQARKALKKGVECVIVKIEKDGGEDDNKEMKIMVDNEQCAELEQILNTHGSCFPQELPMDLPPSRRTEVSRKCEYCLHERGV